MQSQSTNNGLLIAEKYRLLLGILAILSLLLAMAPKFARQVKDASVTEKPTILKAIREMGQLYVEPYKKAGRRITLAFSQPVVFDYFGSWSLLKKCSTAHFIRILPLYSPR